ncbi:MAG: TaqI-like C-terminal specificity domain-containing protein [Anaerolineales bacterium]
MTFTFDQSKDEIARLVKHFSTNQAAFMAPGYKEAQARQEFIDPLFIALNWDVRNQQQTAPEYREVIVEDSLEMEGHEARKAPDYVFRIGRDRKFFAEAKKPGVDLKMAAGPAYQLRRYSWSAKLPLSVLADFQEWVSYDCRIRPSEGDKTSTARLVYMTYEEYADRWHEIWDVYSRRAVWDGSFDQFALSSRGKRGTSEVDAEFLKEIEGWRNSLAHNIALRNPDLTLDEMNDAVQRTIDRIIFLRMVEARGMEEYGQLQKIADNDNIYANLLLLSIRADAKYNSGLFDFSKAGDLVTPRLTVDDKTLKPILADLYYPKSPYEFSVLPIEILGNVYEQFLGKVIHLTDAHYAKVEEKPEVKKAGGVYYTPSYIVEYIVKNTVGKQIEGKSPAQLMGFRVLDPACGSGSFLLGAYSYLLDYYHNWYGSHEPGKKKEAVAQQADGSWQLTLPERKRILIEHIFGVDIDRQACEVTKLSLLLKVLEGVKQLTLFNERALPNLDNNIKCGNSLVGSDYFAGQMIQDSDELRRINPFDWEQGFSEAMQEGGFDCVIGNPPYIFTRELILESERRYYSTNYKLSWEKQNTFMLFMQLMMRLLDPKGIGGFIVPNSWLTIESAHLLREAFIQRLITVIDLNYAVFNQVSMEPSIFLIAGSSQDDNVLTTRVASTTGFSEMKLTSINRNKWSAPDYRISFSDSAGLDAIVEKMVDMSQPIGNVFGVRTGLQAYERGKGNPPQTAADVANHIFDRDKKIDKNSVRYLQGEDIDRYLLNWSGMWMQYGPWLSQPRDFEIFCRPRVLIREITSSFPRCLNATFVTGNYLNNKSILNVIHNSNNENELNKLVAILNSRLMSIYYKHRAVKAARKIFPKIVIKNLREFPFPRFTSKLQNDRLSDATDQMLALQKRKATTKDAADKERLQRLIDSTDQKIDSIVYELYKLTPEKVAIAEGAVKD